MRALLAYVVLTLVLTWPMVTRLHLMDAGDSAFFAWEMAWEIHALETDPRQLPHANIFHPLRYTLGLDEPVLGTTLLALPFALFSSDAVWIFGVTRLLTFVFSAFTAFLLARELGAGPRAAFLGGAAFAFSLVRCDQIGHLSTLGTQWLPLVVLFTHRFTRTGRARDSVLAGVFFVLSALACGYHGLIALIVLPLAALPLVWKRAHLARPALAGIGVAVAGLLPLYALHRAALDPERYARGEGETRLYSASLETFLAAPWWSWLYGDLTARFRGAGNELFLGIAVLLPIAIGAWQLSRERRRPSREAVALLVMALAAALVALGPEIRVGEMRLGPGPYGWLRDAIPLFQKIRVPARAGVFLALAASMLAAKVWARWEKRPWILALCGAAVVADSLGLARPTLEGVAVVDSRQPPPPVYRWLAEQPGEMAVVELPIHDINAPLYRPAYHESIYMIHSTRHWKRLVNGYAGIEPGHYRQMREESRRFPSTESIARFRQMGVRYVIVHSAGYGPLKWARIERELPRFGAELRQVGVFGGDFVYELSPL
jgi:hypothetical protein